MSAEKQKTIECTIPLSNVHTSSLQVLSPRDHGEKILFPLRYEDPLFSSQTVTLLLPPLKLKAYSASTQLLEVYADSILSKLQAIQEGILANSLLKKGGLLQHLYEPLKFSSFFSQFLNILFSLYFSIPKPGFSGLVPGNRVLRLNFQQAPQFNLSYDYRVYRFYHLRILENESEFSTRL